MSNLADKQSPPAATLVPSNANWLFERQQWRDLWWSSFESMRKSGAKKMSPRRLPHAIADAYLNPVKLLKIFTVSRLEWVGNEFWSGSVCPSEFRGFNISGDVDGEEAVSYWSEAAEHSNCDMIALANVHSESVAAKSLKAYARQSNFTLFTQRRPDGVVVRAGQSFDEYLASLNSSTRRKLFNERKKLDSPEFRLAAGENERSAALDFMESAIRRRFGAIPGSVGDFFARVCSDDGWSERIEMSVLRDRDNIVSVAMCIAESDNVFYLRSGFDELISSVSLGLLHLGYCIERCLTAGQSFWLLSGTGLNSQYKNKLGSCYSVEDIRVVRNRSLQKLYSLKALVRKRGQSGEAAADG